MPISSEFHANSTAVDAGSLDSRQTRLDKVISSAHSAPRGFHVEQNEAEVAGPTAPPRPRWYTPRIFVILKA